MRSSGGSRVLAALAGLLRTASVDGEEEGWVVVPGGADRGAGWRKDVEAWTGVVVVVDERTWLGPPWVVVGRREEMRVGWRALVDTPPPPSTRPPPVSKSDGVDAEAPISVVGLSPRPPSPRTLMALDDPRRVRPRAHFALGLRALPSAIARPPPPPPPAVWSGDETDREGDDGGRPSLACPSGERRPAPTADGRRVDDCAVGSQTSGEPVAEGRRLAAARTDEAHDDGGGSVGTC